MIRTLSTSAFEYILTSEAEPTESELNDLLNITESVFRDLYVAFFLSRPDAGFSKLQISSLTAHRRTLIEFHVDLFFQGNGTVPDLAQLEEVARQQFAAGAEYEILYLERLQTSSIYGSTSLLLFISDEEELIALVALADQSSGTNISVNETVATIDPRAKGNSSSSVTRIVSPLAAFAGVLVIIGALVHIKRNRNASGLDRNENLMKHTRDDEYCAETGTISGNTYRTSAFSDDGTFSSAPIFNAYKKKHQNYDHKKGQEKATEMDDVSLGDDARSTVSVTSGTHSRTNSFDSSSSVGTMVKAVRATMSADDFKPKAKQYDESKKPVWASRGTITQPKFTQLDTQEVDLEQIDDCCSQSVVNDELKDELYLPQLGNQNVAEEAKAMVTESKLSLPTEKKSGLDEHEPSTPIARHDAGHVVMERSVEVAASTDDEKPAWMKANVRPIASNPPSPSRAITSQPSSDEPEWMRKFKQMGLDKQE